MPCPEKFRESLLRFQVPQEMIQRVNEGYEDLVSSSPVQRRAAYFQRATTILAQSIDDGLMRRIYEWNACCKGGSREKASRAFARQYAALCVAERIEKIPEVPWMGLPRLEADGSIVLNAVSLACGNGYGCACTNFRTARGERSVPKQYCYCCAGHFLHHYRMMLGVKLRLAEIVSSPLDSGGASPCVMRFTILPD